MVYLYFYQWNFLLVFRDVYDFTKCYKKLDINISSIQRSKLGDEWFSEKGATAEMDGSSKQWK